MNIPPYNAGQPLESQSRRTSAETILKQLGINDRNIIQVFKTLDDAKLRTYLDAVSYYKEKGWEIGNLTSGFAELVKAKASEEQWKVYTNAVAFYKEKGWRIGNLTYGFAELVKAKASKEQLKVYTDLIRYCMEKEISLDGLERLVLKDLASQHREVMYQILDAITNGEKINLQSTLVRDIIKLIIKPEEEESSAIIQIFLTAGIIDLKPNSEGVTKVVLKAEHDIAPVNDDELNKRLDRFGYNTDFSEN